MPLVLAGATSGSATVQATDAQTVTLTLPASSGTLAVSGDSASFVNLAYTGTLTGGTGIVNLGSGQFYKDASGNVGIGTSAPAQLLEVAASNNGLTSTTANNTIRLTDTDTSSATNQPIGKIEFYSSDANAPAGVKAYVLATSSGSQPGSSLSFATANTAADATEAMRIDSSGNVGIGTTNPTANLEVTSTTNSVLRMRAGNTSSSIIQFGDTDDGNVGEITYSHSTNSMAFDTNDVERMRIDSDGNLLVGTTSTAPRDFTSGTGSKLPQAGAASEFATSDAITMFLNNTQSASGAITYIAFRQQAATRGSITTNGSTMTYGGTSDYRLKDNIAPLTGALDIVKQLKPSSFVWKNTGIEDNGFIAHELQAFCPNAVVGEKDAVDEDGNPVYQQIDTSFLVATLTAAIQELKATVDAQAARIAVLEGAK
jgi:hypothetical protein